MAQGTLWLQPIQHIISSSVTNVSGAKAYFYLAGTTTPVAVYTDVGLTIPHAVPVVADANGIFAEIFLTPSTAYKVDVQTSAGISLTGYPADNQLSIPASSSVVDSTETAGESLAAGAAAYLSDGSGGKTPGLIYKADSTNAYSSVLPPVGIVPNAIASGASGIFRTDGVAPVSGVVIGTDYYIGVAGALTATAPSNNPRLIGRTDTATSILVGNPRITAVQAPVIIGSVSSPSALFNGICQGRLTLTSGTPVTTADVVGATAILWTPYGGRNISLYDGVANWTLLPFIETSLALGTLTSGRPYDVFAFNNSGTLALEILSWASTSARATALALQDGVYVKSGVTTRRYLGTFQTTSTTQTEDSQANRYVWNYYNRTPRTLQRFEGAGTWNYTTATVRQANGSASNQVSGVIGVAEVPVNLTVTTAAFSAAAGAQLQIGIGADVTNAFSAGNIGGFTSVTSSGSTAALALLATYQAFPAVGSHIWAWCEWSNVSGGTTTWNATSGATSPMPSGLIGYLLG